MNNEKTQKKESKRNRKYFINDVRVYFNSTLTS